MKLKICNNLHLIDGKIISYSTTVGRVTPTGIKVNGKYSRSTTKHVGKIAGILGIPIEYISKENQWFDWYEFGANVKYDGAISQKSTLVILSKIRETGCSLVNAAVLALSEIKGKDQLNCINQLLKKGVDRQRIDDILALSQLGLV